MTVPSRGRKEGRCAVAYIYFMKDNPDRVAAVAPDHAAHWRGRELGTITTPHPSSTPTPGGRARPRCRRCEATLGGGGVAARPREHEKRLRIDAVVLHGIRGGLALHDLLEGLDVGDLGAEHGPRSSARACRRPVSAPRCAGCDGRSRDRLPGIGRAQRRGGLPVGRPPIRVSVSRMRSRSEPAASGQVRRAPPPPPRAPI